MSAADCRVCFKPRPVSVQLSDISWARTCAQSVVGEYNDCLIKCREGITLYRNDEIGWKRPAFVKRDAHNRAGMYVCVCVCARVSYVQARKRRGGRPGEEEMWVGVSDGDTRRVRLRETVIRTGRPQLSGGRGRR